jgi:hypothetical protein
MMAVFSAVMVAADIGITARPKEHQKKTKKSHAVGLTGGRELALLRALRNKKSRTLMPENENQPPVPSKQTSSVPLKKETVRVTLKAADAPPAVPSSTVPMAPPARPPVPGAPPTPTAPSPTIPLRAVGAPTMTPAPTIRLATSASATGALRPGGGTLTLPKATVQLQAPTQPLGTAFPISQPSMFKVAEDEEEDANAGVINILAGVGLAAAIVVLILQLMLANVWISAEDNVKTGDWAQLIE